MKRKFWQAPKMDREALLLFLSSFLTVQICLYLTWPEYQNPRIFFYSLILCIAVPNVVMDTISRMKTRESKIFSLYLAPKEVNAFKEKHLLMLNEEERTNFKKNLGVEFPHTGLTAQPIPEKEDKWEILIQNEPLILKLKTNKISIYKKVKKAIV